MRFRIATIFLVLVAGLRAGLAEDVAGGRDLVIGSGADAVRIRIVILIDGQSLASRRRAALASIVQAADANQDGTLSEEEWRRASQDMDEPTVLMAGSELEAAVKALVPQLKSPLEFVEQPRPLVDRLDLFKALDNDGNHELTAGEFDRAAELIDWYDADGDGVLNMPELAPTEPLRPMPVSTASKLAAGRYPFAWERPAGEADAVVEIKLIGRAFGRPKIAARIVNDRDSGSERITITPARRSVELTIGESTIVLDARVALVSSQDVKRFYLLQLRQRDADKNGYLDEGEFLGLALPELGFATADANGDGMLFADELREKLDGLIARKANRVRIEISYEREALFTRLDVDEDNRLSRRELRAAGDHAGVEQADAVALRDFGGRYRLEFGVPSLLDEASPTMQAGVRSMARARMDPNGEGPAWFRAMDRNADGDLVRREFLGSGERFGEIDADGDGLLALEELEAWSIARE